MDLVTEDRKNADTLYAWHFYMNYFLNYSKQKGEVMIKKQNGLIDVIKKSPRQDGREDNNSLFFPPILSSHRREKAESEKSAEYHAKMMLGVSRAHRFVKRYLICLLLFFIPRKNMAAVSSDISF